MLKFHVGHLHSRRARARRRACRGATRRTGRLRLSRCQTMVAARMASVAAADLNFTMFPLSVLVVSMSVTLCGTAVARSHIHGALHAGVVVPRLQTREVDLAGLGELPDHLARLARSDGHLIGVRVL